MRHVLFLCTGNSARSILAEALLNHSSRGRGRYRGFSAGSHPRGEVHPLAIETLRAHGISTDGLRSKSWDEFAVPGAQAIDVVITVCDNAAAEACPVWPGHPIDAHWGIPDPAAVEGVEAQRRSFTDAFVTMRRRIDLLVNLPDLPRADMQHTVRAIGAVDAL